MIFLPFIVFGLGLIIGSFLNVVILRMNTGRSIVTSRSTCAHCARTLSWYELIPVASFLGLRGKCRTCHSAISFQYALVELVTAITFTVLYIAIFLARGINLVSLIEFAFVCTVASLLIVITVYDMRHKIIPNAAVYAFIALSFLSILWGAAFIPGFRPGETVVAGAALALPFFLTWYFSKGRLMGFGDVKLALGIGWLLGFSGGVMALLFSFWIGGIFGLFLLALTRNYSMKSEVPFAPFLIIGTAIAGIWGITLSSFFGIWV